MTFQIIEKLIAEQQLEDLQRKVTGLQSQVAYLEAQLERERTEHKQHGRPSQIPLTHSRVVTKW